MGKKTLYISDLDGTLLQPEAVLSDRTVDGLNRLLDRGMDFTVATARTAATVRSILGGVQTRLPVVLMSGVLIYDIAKNEYLKVVNIGREQYLRALSILRAHGVSGFVYTLTGNVMKTYYEKLDTPDKKRFYDERVALGKKFYEVGDFGSLASPELIYISVSGSYEELAPCAELINGVDGLHAEFYRDVYSENGCWLLETAGSGASKYSAVRWLRERFGFDEVVCFGDNMNDLPMFEASDRGYAVANARQPVKDAAAGVIGANTDDGVVRWLTENFRD